MKVKVDFYDMGESNEDWYRYFTKIDADIFEKCIELSINYDDIVGKFNDILKSFSNLEKLILDGSRCFDWDPNKLPLCIKCLDFGNACNVTNSFGVNLCTILTNLDTLIIPECLFRLDDINIYKDDNDDDDEEEDEWKYSKNLKSLIIVSEIAYDLQESNEEDSQIIRKKMIDRVRKSKILSQFISKSECKFSICYVDEHSRGMEIRIDLTPLS